MQYRDNGYGEKEENRKAEIKRRGGLDRRQRALCVYPHASAHMCISLVNCSPVLSSPARTNLPCVAAPAGWKIPTNGQLDFRFETKRQEG